MAKEKTRKELLKMYDGVGDFFEGLARAEKNGKQFHIRLDGTPAYKERYAEVENFHEERAVVRRKNGECFHILPDGIPAYEERFDSVGSFIGGLACAEKGGSDFLIDLDGTRVE